MNDQNNLPLAVVLGGTNPHIDLIKKLKKRGYYTLLLDYLPNPPASLYADKHLRISTLDKEEVERIAREEKASLIITTNIDQANVTACYVAEKIGLKPPYSYETALNVTDKSRMKRIMWENNIPTSKYEIVENINEALEHVVYPAVIKPADSNGSRGVFKVNNDKELRRLFGSSQKESRNNKVVVEGFAAGKEVSFYYFIQNGEPHFINAYQRYNFKSKEGDVIQSTGVVFPAIASEAAYEEMHRISRKIAKAFELKNTPMFIQAIIDGDSVSVLEFAPRVGGGLSYQVITKDCRFDIIEAGIDAFEGKKTDIHIVKPNYYSANLNIYAPGIVVGKISGIDKVIKTGLATDFYQYRLEGAETSKDMSSGSRVGGFLVYGDSIKEIAQKIFQINDIVEIYNINGDKSMRHDIYEVWKSEINQE